MNSILSILIVIVLTMTITSFNSTSTSNSDEILGEVIWEKNGCDYYIIATNKYFVLVEWYRGRLYEGDKVVGPLLSYGIKYLKNKSRNDGEIKVYVEDYWTSKNECFDWLKEKNKCGLGDK